MSGRGEAIRTHVAPTTCQALDRDLCKPAHVMLFPLQKPNRPGLLVLPVLCSFSLSLAQLGSCPMPTGPQWLPQSRPQGQHTAFILPSYWLSNVSCLEQVLHWDSRIAHTHPSVLSGIVSSFQSLSHPDYSFEHFYLTIPCFHFQSPLLGAPLSRCLFNCAQGCKMFPTCSRSKSGHITPGVLTRCSSLSRSYWQCWHYSYSDWSSWTPPRLVSLILYPTCQQFLQNRPTTQPALPPSPL